MTRTVTLADLSPSFAVTAGKATPDTGTKQAVNDQEGATCFAHVLDDAGATDAKTPTGKERDEREEARHKVTSGAPVESGASTSLPVAAKLLASPPPVAPVAPVPQAQSESGHSTPCDLGSRGAVSPVAKSLISPEAAPLIADPNLVAAVAPIDAASSGVAVREPATTAAEAPAAATPGDVVGNTATNATGAGVRSFGSLVPDEVGQPAAAHLTATPGRQAATESPNQLGATDEREDAPVVMASPKFPPTPFPSFGKAVGSDQSAGPQSETYLQSHEPASVTTPAADRPGSEVAAASPVAGSSGVAPFVTTTFGEFAVSLEQAATGSTQNSPRSAFAASNGALTAAISRPINEGSGVYSVTATLNPPSLGHVQAVVKVDGSNVNVSLVAHNADGHRAIAAHLDELRQELSTRGGDVQLSLSDRGTSGRHHDETQAPAISVEDAEDVEPLVLTITPSQTSKSLHVIL